MTSTPARYLLRIDDLCPEVSRQGWQRLRSLIEEFRLEPILAVVPDNRDPALACSPPSPDFWNEMRALESAGATIGLHGYQHLCAGHGRSLLALHRTSEFAGVDAEIQRAWISHGLLLLRSHGLEPRIWVAPRHGFDAQTLAALRAEGMSLLSDGFARRPFIRGGITWIPQQLWAPVEKPGGVWTICIHPTTASAADMACLRGFLNVRASQFISVDRILADVPPTALTLAERLQAECALRRFKLSHAIKGDTRRTLLRSSSSA